MQHKFKCRFDLKGMAHVSTLGTLKMCTAVLHNSLTAVQGMSADDPAGLGRFADKCEDCVTRVYLRACLQDSFESQILHAQESTTCARSKLRLSWPWIHGLSEPSKFRGPLSVGPAHRWKSHGPAFTQATIHRDNKFDLFINKI